MRTVGVLPHGTADLTVHDHVACVGHSSSDLARVATQAFATAPPDQALMLCLDPGGDWDPQAVFAEEIGRGQLEIVDNAEAYAATRGDSDADGQLRQFDDALRAKLAAGFSGMRVVADNTAFLTGSHDEARRWFAWEQRTDRWQARRPVTGVCWFDDRRVPPDRLAAVLHRHPASSGRPVPAWRLHHDEVPAGTGNIRLRLSGEVEAHDTEQLLLAVEVESVLASEPGGLVIDAAELAYLHHRPLLGLSRRGAVLRNGPAVVRRMTEVTADVAAGVPAV